MPPMFAKSHLFGGVALVVSPLQAEAWTEAGHKIVAQIAKNGLTAEEAAFFDRMTTDLYSEDALKMRKGTKYENDGDDIVSVAGWNDEINAGFPFQKQWHFTDGVLRLDDGCQLGDEFYLGYKTDKQIKKLRETTTPALRIPSGLSGDKLSSVATSVSNELSSAFASGSQFLAKLQIPDEVLTKIDEATETEAATQATKEATKAQEEASKSTKEASKTLSSLFEQAKRLGKNLLGRKLSQLEETPEDKEDLNDWGPRVEPDPKTTHPQDVIYGLEHAYYGIIDRIDLKWSDPAILVFQRAYWMRSFIHYLGDLHQPLHATTGCSAAHPQGDRGGNEFKIQTKIYPLFHGGRTPIDELHLLWDLGVGRYADWDTETDHPAFRANIEKEATRIRSKYVDMGEVEVKRIEALPKGSGNNTKGAVVGEFVKYRDESHDMAKKITYNGIVEGEFVEQGYLDTGAAAAEHRIALAGYRMQGFMQHIYKILHHDGEDEEVIYV